MTILKRGYLYKLPRSGMIKHWNKRWMVLHSSSQEGNLRMEYYDNEAHETREIQKRIIPLDGCHAISQIEPIKSKKFVFDFTTKLGRMIFATDTQEDLEEWIKSIRTAVQFDLDLKKQKRFGSSLRDQTSTTSTGSQVVAENVLYESLQGGRYEVLIERNEDSDRLKLEGKYLLVISLDNVRLVKPESEEVAIQWEYKHLKKYGKSTGKFNLECGRASKTGPGKFVFVTNEGRKIFNNIHGNIQLLGSKKEEGTATMGAQSLNKPSPQSSPARSLPKKSHEAPAAIGKSSIPEYAVVDKSKKKKKRSSMMELSNQGSDIATTTGAKFGVFRKLDENAYDTPILESIKPKQPTSKQKPVANVPVEDDVPGYAVPTFFNSAPTKTTINVNTASKQTWQGMDTPFGDEDPCGGYSVPSNEVTSTQKPVKKGTNPFLDDNDDSTYETPMVPDEPVLWEESKLTKLTTKSETKKVVTGDYDVPPDALVTFADNPFSNSAHTYSSPLDTKKDYVNDATNALPSYASSKDGTATTTAMRFESDDEDEDAIINPLLNVEDFAQYLNTDGDDDMWADLVNPKFS